MNHQVDRFQRCRGKTREKRVIGCESQHGNRATEGTGAGTERGGTPLVELGAVYLDNRIIGQCGNIVEQQRAADPLGVNRPPTFYLADAAGKVVLRQEIEVDIPGIESALEELK